jgi:hypothetical protein
MFSVIANYYGYYYQSLNLGDLIVIIPGVTSAYETFKNVQGKKYYYLFDVERFG